MTTPAQDLQAGDTTHGTLIMKTIDTPDQRAQWLNLRSTGVSASEISTILGLNPYGRTALDLWLEKSGQIPPQQETLDMWLGSELEHVIAKRFCMETGLQVYKTGLWESKIRPWQRATPDFGICGENALLECKLTGFTLADQWDDNQASDHAELQSLGQIDVTGADKVYIAALVFGYKKSLEIREVTRNDRLIPHIRAAGERFMRHLTDMTPPPIIDRDDPAHVDRAYPLLEGKRKELSGEALTMFADYEGAAAVATRHRREMDAAEKAKRHALNRLKEYLGGAQIPTVAGEPLGEIIEVGRAGYTVPPSTYTRLKLIKR